MKQLIVIFACALLSPLAFAQSSPTEDENPTPEPVPFQQSSPTEDENPTTGPVPVAQSSPTEDENPTTEPAAMSPSSPTEEENPITEPSPTNVEGTVSGTVLAFTEDEMLVLKATADDPMNFILSNTAYVDGAGNETATPMIQEGTKVRVTYSRNGDQMVANQIVVE